MYNWIDDRPKGFKLQNLAFATLARPLMSSLPKKSDCGRPARYSQMRIFGPKATIDPSPGIHRRLQQHFPRIWQPFDVIFYRTCISSAACYFRAPSVAILTSLRPVVNPLPGCSSGKPVQDQLASGLSCSPIRFFSTAFDPPAWTMVVFWKED